MLRFDMNRFRIFAAGFFLIFLIPSSLIWAGDEEMMNPYTEFDPETGFFIPIEPPVATHEKQQAETIPGVAAATTPKVQASTTPTGLDDISSSADTGNKAVYISAVFVLLLGAGIFWYRHSQKGNT